MLFLIIYSILFLFLLKFFVIFFYTEYHTWFSFVDMTTVTSRFYQLYTMASESKQTPSLLAQET